MKEIDSLSRRRFVRVAAISLNSKIAASNQKIPRNFKKIAYKDKYD
jgi:hypothetical protein